MASANWIVACTIRIAAMFGSTCSNVMRHSPLPQRPGGEYELARAHHQRAGAGDAREHRHVEDADGDDRGHQPGPVDRGQHDRREQRREGEGEVRQAHHRLLDPAALDRGEQAEGDAEGDADADRDQADGDRHPAADDQQRDDVAAEAVGAEPVRPRRRLQLVRDVELGRPDAASRRRTAAPGRSRRRRAPRRSRSWRAATGACARSLRQRRRGGRGGTTALIRPSSAGAGRSPRTARRPRS